MSNPENKVTTSMNDLAIQIRMRGEAMKESGDSWLAAIGEHYLGISDEIDAVRKVRMDEAINSDDEIAAHVHQINGKTWVREYHYNARITELASCRENSKALVRPVEPSTDEKGRPLTHWGGMAENAGSAEPVAWIRYCSDGGYEGPIMDSIIEEVRKRSGNWTPLYARPPAPKTAWIDATTVERNSRPPAPKVSEEKVLEIVDRHMATCRVGQYRQTMVDAIKEALELAGRK